MAFFGFEQNNLLEQEKQKFLRGEANDGQDLAVYTWGEESYDGLGDALQEGGDDFNDETFGGNEPVGKLRDTWLCEMPVEHTSRQGFRFCWYGGFVVRRFRADYQRSWHKWI
jgi:hypothetical protein